MQWIIIAWNKYYIPIIAISIRYHLLIPSLCEEINAISNSSRKTKYRLSHRSDSILQLVNSYMLLQISLQFMNISDLRIKTSKLDLIAKCLEGRRSERKPMMGSAERGFELKSKRRSRKGFRQGWLKVTIGSLAEALAVQTCTL